MNLLYEYLYEQQVMVKLKQEQNTLYSNVLAPHQLQLSSTPAYQIQSHYAIFRGGINYTNYAETRQSRRRQCVGKVIFVHQISKFALYTVATSKSQHRFNWQLECKHDDYEWHLANPISCGSNLTCFENQIILKILL
ncbi:Hypothetical_protein [Hexamita inflata]|uniref:Hypothetical_protein n=1 Tax=Hexamita inflata TaxID=28002 RepID=A0AA86RMJ1_9EUKA|nr:Hypothetical protein HINF_LOCUS62257 [Hexamita inflata]